MLEVEAKEEVDEDFLSRRRRLEYLMPGDIFKSEEGEKFEVLSVGPKKMFAYGKHIPTEGEGEIKRISLNRLAKEYVYVAHFQRY